MVITTIEKCKQMDDFDLKISILCRYIPFFWCFNVYVEKRPLARIPHISQSWDQQNRIQHPSNYKIKNPLNLLAQQKPDYSQYLSLLHVFTFSSQQDIWEKTL